VFFFFFQRREDKERWKVSDEEIHTVMFEASSAASCCISSLSQSKVSYSVASVMCSQERIVSENLDL